MSYTLRDIGKAFQAARERSGLTQRAFAEKAATTQARVSRIETGETDARLSTIVQFARNLDLELMLVPRTQVPAVRAIIAQARNAMEYSVSEEVAEPRPAYRLDDDE